jgi:hypothetical protein
MKHYATEGVGQVGRRVPCKGRGVGVRGADLLAMA